MNLPFSAEATINLLCETRLCRSRTLQLRCEFLSMCSGFRENSLGLEGLALKAVRLRSLTCKGFGFAG